jgi:ABC-2 type transport system ATP-binding protein
MKPPADADPVDAAGAAVAVHDLAKRFGERHALRGVSFRVAAGELFGVIGPDGAGKTTLFRILATLLVPDAGRASVLGLDVVRDLWALRSAVGYMPGRFALYPDLTVDENLRFFASVFGTTPHAQYDLIAPIYRQIERFGDRRARALSGGMKQKLALCCALVHRPRILFLDEPTTGVDAVSRREFWDLLGELRAGGLSILVSTPYMDEAGRCDRVALVQDGRILEIAAPAAIGADYPLPLLAVAGPDRYRILLALREFPYAAAVFPFGAEVHYTDRRDGADPTTIAEELRRFLDACGCAVERVEPIRAGIEDSFMARMATPAEAVP